MRLARLPLLLAALFAPALTASIALAQSNNQKGPAAQRAALRIRFKPAQSSDGRPVDSRATVHITFRLS